MQPVGVVQRLASSGYSYVDPAVGKARSMVPLVDATARRIEQHIPLVIKTADRYVDAVYSKGEAQVLFLQTKKGMMDEKIYEIRTASSDKAVQLLAEFRSLTLTSIERSEALVDRLLPEEESEAAATASLRKSRGLAHRTLAIPMQVPVRGVRIIVVQAGSFSAFLAAQGRRGMSAASESVLALRGASSRKTQALLKSAQDAQKAVVVYINGYYCVLKQGSAKAFASSVQGAFVVTKTVIGNNRAVVVFTKVGEYVPALQPALKEATAAQSPVSQRKPSGDAAARNAAAAQRAAEEIQARRASEQAARQAEARKTAEALQAKRAALSSAPPSQAA